MSWDFNFYINKILKFIPNSSQPYCSHIDGYQAQLIPPSGILYPVPHLFISLNRGLGPKSTPDWIQYDEVNFPSLSPSSRQSTTKAAASTVVLQHSPAQQASAALYLQRLA